MASEQDFIAKRDFFGIGEPHKWGVVSSSDGRTDSRAEGMDEGGSVVAFKNYGTTWSPSNDYIPRNDGTIKGVGDIVLGAVTATQDAQGADFRACLSSFSFALNAGQPVTFSASGVSVDAGNGCNLAYKIPSFDIPTCFKASPAFGELTINGNGYHIQSVSYTCSCDVNTASKDGDVIAHGVSNGRIEAQYSILATGANGGALDIVVGDGWTRGQISCDNPDANYPTYTFTLTRYLDKSEL